MKSELFGLTEALKWADTFGPLQDDPPTGDGPSLLALAAEVRRLQAELAEAKDFERQAVAFASSAAGMMADRLTAENEALQAELAEARGLLDCRAGKLLKKGKSFVVVARDEPYYWVVYDMIRDHEMAKGRWTDEDEAAYLAKEGGEDGH